MSGEISYLIPMHCRDPFENATFHLSRSFPASPSQRSGVNFSGEGKSVGFLMDGGDGDCDSGLGAVGLLVGGVHALA
jgi:hypothetical protein